MKSITILKMFIIFPMLFTSSCEPEIEVPEIEEPNNLPEPLSIFFKEKLIKSYEFMGKYNELDFYYIKFNESNHSLAKETIENFNFSLNTNDRIYGFSKDNYYSIKNAFLDVQIDLNDVNELYSYFKSSNFYLEETSNELDGLPVKLEKKTYLDYSIFDKNKYSLDQVKIKIDKNFYSHYFMLDDFSRYNLNSLKYIENDTKNHNQIYLADLEVNEEVTNKLMSTGYIKEMSFVEL